MPGRITIHRPAGPLQGAIDPPRSKSVANRALILAALAGDLSCVQDPGSADDTRVLLDLLRDRPRVMHCGMGGTTFRFLLAWACVQPGQEHLITGEPRLLERPHDALVDALRKLGARIERTPEGYLVHGSALRGGAVTIDSPVSSQFISALLLVAPLMREGLRLRWTGLRLSEPYVGMTVAMLRRSGAVVMEEGDAIHVMPGGLAVTPIHVPGDWSAAAFWAQLVALAPAGSEVFLAGLQRDGMQGDERVTELWAPLVGMHFLPEGAVFGKPSITVIGDPAPWQGLARSLPATFDLRDTPDLFQPLAFTCAGLGHPATFTGLDNLPLKETDRISAVAQVLKILGIPCTHGDGTFAITGKNDLAARKGGYHVDPRGDHRMAMALAPLALVCERITLTDPEVVTKSYPAFWEDLLAVGFEVKDDR